MAINTVSSSYLDGIAEGRETFKAWGLEMAPAHLATLDALCRQFGPSSPVGQMMRGERDFWRLKVKRSTTTHPQTGA